MHYSGFIMSIKNKFENPKSIFLWIIADQDEKEIGFYCFQFTEHKKNIFFLQNRDHRCAFILHINVLKFLFCLC